VHTVLKLYGLHAEGKIRITSLSQYLAAFRTRKKKIFFDHTTDLYLVFTFFNERSTRGEKVRSPVGILE